VELAAIRYVLNLYNYTCHPNIALGTGGRQDFTLQFGLSVVVRKKYGPEKEKGRGRRKRKDGFFIESITFGIRTTLDQ
jgi:hypothetical protein